MAFYLQSSLVPRYSVLEIQDAKNNVDAKKITVNLMLRINKIVDAVNNRASGVYDLSEGPSLEIYPPVQSGVIPAPRPVYWKTFFAGPLANAGALTIAHGITWTSATTLVGLECHATNSVGVTALKIPYVDVSSTPVTGDIEVYVDATNIVITSAGNASAFNRVVVTLKWLQD